MNLSAIENAVKFLNDPKVKQAPLTKRIAFLEGKGLTKPEIQAALQQAGGESIQISTESGWRDIFSTLITIGLTGAGLLWAAKKYLGPYVDLPSAVSAKKDTESIQKQLEASDKVLVKVTLSTQDVIKGMESHAREVSVSISEITDLLDAIRLSDEKKDKDIAAIKNDIEELKSTFPKLVEKTKGNQASVLADIQTELKSLKTLLLNRKPTGDALEQGQKFIPTFKGVAFGKASIPAWQLENRDTQGSSGAVKDVSTVDVAVEPLDDTVES